jgi:hypothetical protein
VPVFDLDVSFTFPCNSFFYLNPGPNLYSEVRQVRF